MEDRAFGTGIRGDTNTSSAITVSSTVYDQGNGMSCPDTLTDILSLDLHDSAYGTNFRYRGNPVKVTSMGASRCVSYDVMGTARQSADSTGNTVGATTDSSTGYSLPSTVTPNSQSNLSTAASYNGAFAVMSVSGANGAAVNTTYDNFGRPATSTSADGVKTAHSDDVDQSFRSDADQNGAKRRRALSV